MTSQEFQELKDHLAEMPGALERLVAELKNQDVTLKPSANEFSVLENVCHLRDIEEEGYRVRIEKLLNESQPFLADLDGDRLARERDYNSESLDAALLGFKKARMVNVRALEGLPPDRLNRSGTFEGIGPVTLLELLAMMREHDQSHLKDLSDLRDRLAAHSQYRLR